MGEFWCPFAMAGLPLSVKTLARPIAAALLLGGLALDPLPTRAELPPWVYGDQQRQAPVVVRLVVLETAQRGDEASLRCQVLRVWRQPSTHGLKRGQTIQVRYSVPPQRPPGWVGPSALAVPRVGERLLAWLSPIANDPGSFAPAAGGRSFGPSMEGFREPQSGK
jgi:hypothetical protein